MNGSACNIHCIPQTTFNDIIVPIYTPLYDGNQTTVILDDLYEEEIDIEYDNEDWVDA